MEFFVIGLLIAFPVALLFIFKSNAALCFFILLASAFTAQYAVPNLIAKDLNSASSSLTSSNVANILLLTVPWILAGLLTAKSSKGKKLYVQLLPAICLSLVFAYLISTYLPSEPPFYVSADNVVLKNISKYIAQIMSFGLGISLVIALLLRKQSKKDKKH